MNEAAIAMRKKAFVPRRWVDDLCRTVGSGYIGGNDYIEDYRRETGVADPFSLIKWRNNPAYDPKYDPPVFTDKSPWKFFPIFHGKDHQD